MKQAKLIIALLAITMAFALRTEAQPQLQASTGKLTFLRVHDVGTGFGPASDFLDVEVVVQLDTQPGKAFGFQLRDDANRPVRQALVDLLRDAFEHDWTVTLVFWREPGKNNGRLIRIDLAK
jgi:hypothetical protein